MNAETQAIAPEIDAELRSIEAAAAAEAVRDVPPAERPPDDPAEAWRKPIRAGLRVFRDWAKNWDVSPEACDLVEEAAADVLGGWMPGGIQNMERWGKWAKLGAGLGMIALANFNFQTLEFKPLRVDDAKQKDAGRPADTDFGPEPVG